MKSRIEDRKSPSASTQFQLQVTLHEVSPLVWRQFVIPSSTKLNILHSWLQLIMGWMHSHLHEFELGDRRFGVPDDDEFDEKLEDESMFRLDELMAKPGDRLIYRLFWPTYDIQSTRSVSNGWGRHSIPSISTRMRSIESGTP